VAYTPRFAQDPLLPDALDQLDFCVRCQKRVVRTLPLLIVPPPPPPPPPPHQPHLRDFKSLQTDPSRLDRFLIALLLLFLQSSSPLQSVSPVVRFRLEAVR